MDVLTLLQSKNRCLKKFLDLSADFLKSAEAGDFRELSSFETRRESTIKALELYDRKISEIVELLGPTDRTPELASQVQRELNLKESLIHEILAVDLKIIGKIEEEKNRILREVASTRKSKEAMSKFKSTWTKASGDELDEKL